MLGGSVFGTFGPFCFNRSLLKALIGVLLRTRAVAILARSVGHEPNDLAGKRREFRGPNWH